MPKILDYPKSSFSSSMDMAEAIDSLGGSCEKESCADQMGLKVTGSFSKRIGSTVKYNLITSTKGRLETTDLYRSIKNSYNEEERLKYIKEAFLSPPVYNSLYGTFKGKKLPVDILDKYLIREFDVEDKNASTVARIFLNDLESIGLLENGVIKETTDGVKTEISPDTEEDEVEDFTQLNDNDEEVSNRDDETQPVKYNNGYPDSGVRSQILHIENQNRNRIEKQPNEFLIHVSGPGIDSEIVIKEQEDLLIVEAMLKKVKKKL
jgi:hypothetical protein